MDNNVRPRRFITVAGYLAAVAFIFCCGIADARGGGDPPISCSSGLGSFLVFPFFDADGNPVPPLDDDGNLLPGTVVVGTTPVPNSTFLYVVATAGPAAQCDDLVGGTLTMTTPDGQHFPMLNPVTQGFQDEVQGIIEAGTVRIIGYHPYSARFTDNGTNGKNSIVITHGASPGVPGDPAQHVTIPSGGANSSVGIGPIVMNDAGQVVTTCDGDVDWSGSMDIGDLVTLLVHWDECRPMINVSGENGHVNIGDVLEVIEAWGQCD